MLLSIEDIAKIGQIAALLEVSAYPKPGNVHRTQNFDDMSFEDFLISSVCMGKHLEQVSQKGYKYYPNMLNQINIGENILGCVEDTNKLVNTNTNLGISLLFMPLAATFGAMLDEDNFDYLPNTLDILMRNTVEDDAIAFVKAIVLSKAGGIKNKSQEYDVNNTNTIDQIIEDNINLYKLLKISSKYDRLSYELTNKLPVITKVGYPACSEILDEYSRNDVTLETYLTILANTPDTLITRKYGEKIAESVSKKAKEIINETQIATEERLSRITDFDKYLRKHKYNPGSTADFTAATLFVTLMDKYSKTTL